MNKVLGKISKIKFGNIGYQGGQFGLMLILESDQGHVTAEIAGGWIFERSDGAKWTESDRIVAHGEMAVKVMKIMRDANINNINDLVGKPVEITFNGMTLQDWRILTEVI